MENNGSPNANIYFWALFKMTCRLSAYFFKSTLPCMVHTSENTSLSCIERIPSFIFKVSFCFICFLLPRHYHNTTFILLMPYLIHTNMHSLILWQSENSASMSSVYLSLRYLLYTNIHTHLYAKVHKKLLNEFRWRSPLNELCVWKVIQ